MARSQYNGVTLLNAQHPPRVEGERSCITFGGGGQPSSQVGSTDSGVGGQAHCSSPYAASSDISLWVGWGGEGGSSLKPAKVEI